MDDLNELFNLDEAIDGTVPDDERDIDIYSTPEETLDRVFILRTAVASVFGKKAAFNHPFFEEKQPDNHGKTPYRMACEGPEGLRKALVALKNRPC